MAIITAIVVGLIALFVAVELIRAYRKLGGVQRTAQGLRQELEDVKQMVSKIKGGL